MKLAWFAGVDWGSQKHQACVLDAVGKVLGERAFEHGGQGLAEMADWLLSFASGEAGEAGEVGVAIETPRGPYWGRRRPGLDGRHGGRRGVVGADLGS